MKKYLFDTNFFLDSDLRYYSHTFFNDFWEFISYYLSKQDNFKSIVKVKQELIAKDDWISDFVKNKLPKQFFINETKYGESYTQIINYSQNLDVRDTAKEKFADETRADAWLIAVALKDGYTIVSNEKIVDIKERKNIKIPRVCQYFQIECIDIFSFIQDNEIEFGVKKPSRSKESLFE